MTTGGGRPETRGVTEPLVGPQTPSGCSSANTAPATSVDHHRAALKAVLELLDPETAMATVPFSDGKRYFAEADIRRVIAEQMEGQ